MKTLVLALAAALSLAAPADVWDPRNIVIRQVSVTASTNFPRRLVFRNQECIAFEKTNTVYGLETSNDYVTVYHDVARDCRLVFANNVFTGEGPRYRAEIVYETPDGVRTGTQTCLNGSVPHGWVSGFTLRVRKYVHALKTGTSVHYAADVRFDPQDWDSPCHHTIPGSQARKQDEHLIGRDGDTSQLVRLLKNRRTLFTGYKPTPWSEMTNEGHSVTAPWPQIDDDPPLVIYSCDAPFPN